MALASPGFGGPTDPSSTPRDQGRAPRARRGPLAGIRVVDFCWSTQGPVATRFLADFGAEVIKVEGPSRLDSSRRFPMHKNKVRTLVEEVSDSDPNTSGLFNNYCRNKLGITIDLGTSRGRELAERLISMSSVVTENFAPGVMERWGFTYERLRELVPDVIYARMSGYGHSGPHHTYHSFGAVVQAASGLTFAAGLPGREPSGWGLWYLDQMGAYAGAAGILAAIWNRKRTGSGTEIDMSSFETGVSLLGPVILDVSVNGRTTHREDYPTGNRLEYPHAAPHGVYPCSGEDRWVAIAVFDDTEWDRLVKAIGDPDWAREERFSTQRARFSAQDELDELLSTWTTKNEAHWIMHHLQSHGVRASAVQNSRDLAETDAQLAHRGTFFEMDHPLIGPATFDGFPALMSGEGADHWRSAPLLGEDNDYVFGHLLGLDAAELSELASEGVI